MVPAKNWQADAVIRLVLSVIICAYAGSMLVSVAHYASAPAKVTSKLFFPLSGVALACLAGALALLGKSWRPETLFRRMVALLLCGYGGLLLGAWVQRFSGVEGTQSSTWRMAVMSLSFHGAGLILIWRFLREQQSPWLDAFGFANQWRRAVLVGLLGTLVFLPIGIGLHQLSGWLITHLPHLRMEPQEQVPIHALRVSMSWGGRIALAATAVLLAPAAEEMMFRGILYPVIKQLGHPQLALWGTSLLFATVHMNLASFVPLTILALVLTALYERTNNLLAPITAHMLFNTEELARLLWQLGP